MAKFKKGQSGNPKGRPKGSLNEKTKYIREWVVALIGSNAQTLAERFKRLDARTQFDVIVKLMPYVLPRQVEQKLNANVDFSTLSDEQLDSFISTITSNILNDDGTDE